MSEPADMIVPLLREMRAENNTRHQDLLGRFDIVEKRLASIESAQQSFKQALSADSLLSRLVTGEFEQRIEALEQKVEQLEATR